MVRNRVRKTTRGSTPADVMLRAATEVMKDKHSCRATAKKYGIPHVTLSRYVKKLKKQEELGKVDINFASPTSGFVNVLSTSNALIVPTSATAEPSTSTAASATANSMVINTTDPVTAMSINFEVGYKKPRQVLNPEEEEQLVQYIMHASQIYYGLCPRELRKLAYNYAVANNKVIHESWVTKMEASKDWFNGFMKRHSNISIRVPESTSLARATSFNEKNVNDFFNNLQIVMMRYSFGPESIYNVDETGVTTVHKSIKIVAAKGTKQIGGMTSGERGSLVTICTAVNAAGTAIPPIMVLSRVIYKDHFVYDGPPGGTGASYQSA